MTNPIYKIRKLAQFDERLIWEEHQSTQAVKGGETEHARMMEIVTALCDALEKSQAALEKIANNPDALDKSGFAEMKMESINDVLSKAGE